MDKTKTEKLSLIDILVKSTYLTQTTSQKDLKCENPIQFGCGFMVNYKETNFFITADHVVHPLDYEVGNRTGEDFTVSIFNNFKTNNDTLSTIVTPLGGFNYLESFNIEKPDCSPQLVDLSLCILKEKHFEYPFLTDEKEYVNEESGFGQQKLILYDTSFSVPNDNLTFFVYGKIRTELIGILLHRENTLKTDLKYVCESGDYFLLNTPEIIEDIEEWSGLSGSPVWGSNGKCIGILCSVTIETKSIWVMNYEKVKTIMDVAILQEQLMLERENN